jgi:hypothetical protein
MPPLLYEDTSLITIITLGHNLDTTSNVQAPMAFLQSSSSTLPRLKQVSDTNTQFYLYTSLYIQQAPSIRYSSICSVKVALYEYGVDYVTKTYCPPSPLLLDRNWLTSVRPRLTTSFVGKAICLSCSSLLWVLTQTRNIFWMMPFVFLSPFLYS